MDNVYTLLNSEIGKDNLSLFNVNYLDYGRIKDIMCGNDITSLTLFHSQIMPERTYTIKNPLNNNLKTLKRGDIIAFKGNEIKITEIEQIILLNSPNNFPKLDEWSDEDGYVFRELDVEINPSVMDRFRKRNKIVFGIREYMQKNGYFELELPILKKIPDIAPSPHFKTKSLDGSVDLFLRTTFPPFERMLVGFEQVYTMGPNFRNGDYSYKNLPEFQMFCMGTVAKDHFWSAEFLQSMFLTISKKLNGHTKVIVNNKEYDLTKWERISFADAFLDLLNYDIYKLDSDQNLVDLCEREKVILPKLNKSMHGPMLRAVLFDAVFEQRIVNHFQNPVYFYNVPWYLAGPAEKLEESSFTKLRGEGYIGGIELMNSKCILTSVVHTKEWHHMFTEEKKRLGFNEFATRDFNFIKSIGYGLFPGSLASFGLDRLVMMLLKADNIKEITLYPLI